MKVFLIRKTAFNRSYTGTMVMKGKILINDYIRNNARG